MPITNISRDWGVKPSIVRVVTTDNFSTITAAGYLNSQISEIQSINFGKFDWTTTDYVLISYSGGEGYFTPDYTVNFTFVPAPAEPGSLALNNGNIFIGNASNVAAGAPVTGVISLTNTGVTSYVAESITGAAIANNTITSAEVATNLIQYGQLTGITAAQMQGMYAAPIEVIVTPGAGMMVVILAATFNVTGATAPFAAGGAVTLQYGSAAHAGSPASTALAAATLIGFGTTNSNATLTCGNAGEASTATANMGIYLTNATQPFTGGTTSLTNIYVQYVVVPVA